MKKSKKILSCVMVIIIAVGIIPIGIISSSAAGGVQAKLDSFISSYPSGSRWTGTFDGGSQCYGFGKMVIYNIFGKNSSGGYRSWTYAGVSTSGMNVIGSITSFSASNVQGLLSKAKCGDVLQFNTTTQHTMIVYSVNSTGVTIYDCNWDGNCGIRKKLSSFGAWSGINSSKLTLLRSNNYDLIDGPAVSHTVNSSYGKNFTAYPKAKITASNIFDENHNQIGSGAWIGTSDKCTIHEVYTDGCCKVTYPLDGGGTRTAYSKISLFNTHTHNYTGARLYEIEHPHQISQRCVDYYTCGGYYWTGEYQKVNTCEKCWYIDWNCSVSSLKLKVGESKAITISIDSLCAPDGANLSSDYNKSLVEVNVSGKTFTFKALKAGSCNYVLTVYSDSTLSKVVSTFNLPISVETQTYSVSYDANGGTGAPSSQTKIYGQTLTLSSTKPTRTGYTFLGWSTSSTATSAEYSAGGSYTANSGATLYAVWKANTYTVSYNANGGTGAPSSQTKTYGQTLTLSSTMPTRTGYTFLGWSTSSTATSAEYSAGGSYTANSGVTLYAVWKCGHNYTASTVNSATCTTDGLRKYTCSQCGNIYTEAISYLGHNYSTEWITDIPATYTQTGSKSHHCTRCNAKTDITGIPKLINSISSITIDTTNVKKEYLVGDSLDTTNLILTGTYSDGSTKIITSGYSVESTILNTTGTKTITVSYDGKTATYDITVNAKDHANHTGGTEIRNQKSATCSENGYTGDTYCLDCGIKIATGTVIAATGKHTPQVIPGKAATCTEKGLTDGSKCSVCSAILKAQEEIQATGHSFGEWTEVTAATVDAQGLEKRVCSVCGEEETRATDKLPPVVFLLGDVNGDGKIKANDARIILRVAAGLDTLPEDKIKLADMNGDGKIKANDARVVLRIAAGLE